MEIMARGGSNVARRKIGRLLGSHLAVLECAVLGLPNAVLGERVVAIVRSRPEILVTESELIAFPRERLADYKVPE